MNKKFELGISFVDLSLLEGLEEYIDSITVGTSIIPNIRGSFFPLEQILNMKEKYPDYSMWVVANAAHTTEDDLIPLSMSMHSWYNLSKIKGYIVSDPKLALLLTKNGIPVNISSTCDIQTISQVEFYVQNGISHIHLSTKLNRNLEAVEKICNEYPKVTFYLTANEFCEFGCPYGLNHYRIESPITTTHKYHCGLYDLNQVGSISWNSKVLQTPFIPPENLDVYPKNVIFKLSSRVYPTEYYQPKDVVRLLRIYSGKEQYSDILDLFSLNIPELKKASLEVDKTLFSNWKTCSNNCHECNLCQKALERR